MKKSDNGSAGLNRGNSMHIKKPLQEGVVFGKNGKWLVRIRKRGIIVSMASYDKKEDAELHYTKLVAVY